MPVNPGTPLASGYISEKIACERRFFSLHYPSVANLVLHVSIVFIVIRHLLFA